MDRNSIVTDYTTSKLTVRNVGLLLSEGLDTRATSSHVILMGNDSCNAAENASLNPSNDIGDDMRAMRLSFITP
jgi:hypothetical protein